MTDGDEVTVQRHGKSIFSHTVVALGLFPSVETFEDQPDYDADEWLKNRLFLAKMQVQTFDQV